MSATSIEKSLGAALSDDRAAENVSKRELRVLQIFHGLGMGGAETWLMSLLKFFPEQNERAPLQVKFDVLLTGGQQEVFDDEAAALGANLFYVPFTRRKLASFVREFRRILKDGKYDAIHDHQDYVAGLHFAIGAGLLPSVRVAHVHNPLYHRTNRASFSTGKLNQIGKYFVGRFATHVMGTSRQIISEYGFDQYAGKVTLGAAHCGFDVQQFRGEYAQVHAELCREFGWEQSARILLFVGRLDGAEFLYKGKLMTHKNPALALEVARVCLARDKRVKLLMVGSGKAKATEFAAQVAEWGLDKDIRFLGSRSDVPRLMMGCDLLLFPSVAEGLGMVVVEAQAAGLPVLASDTTPRECVVVSELLDFVSLTGDAQAWANHALQRVNAPRPANQSSNQTVAKSDFAIENSARRLVGLYSNSVA